jgi:hypothetical protein
VIYETKLYEHPLSLSFLLFQQQQQQQNSRKLKWEIFNPLKLEMEMRMGEGQSHGELQ